MGLTTDLVIPLEVGRDGELHFQSRAGDRLQMDCQVQFGKLVDVFVDGLPHFWHSDQLTWKMKHMNSNCSPGWGGNSANMLWVYKTHQFHCGWGHRDAQRGSFSSRSSWSLPLAASWTVAVETLTATCGGQAYRISAACCGKTQHCLCGGERVTDLHSLVNHLAKIHGLVCQLSPASVEYNLKYGPH